MSEPNGLTSADRVAVVALIVSLVALVATTGQLLQQYFATADGYRRCQESVMGDWGKKTRLRWRWRQFRFETLYSTPVISMADISIFFVEPPRQLVILGMEDTNGKENDNGVPIFKPSNMSSNRQLSDELVSWLSLLEQMNETTRLSMEPLKTQTDSFPGVAPQAIEFDLRRFPVLKMAERSWDFQPPDVLRPLAKTTLSTIAVMARRMGMRWKVFRPEEGIMYAEGNGHLLTSTLVRTLGLVMQYSHQGMTGSYYLNTALGFAGHRGEEVYIPTPASDSLGSGVVRGDETLSVPDFTLNTQEEIGDALNMLDTRGECRVALKDLLRENPTFKFPVGDLVALTMSPMCHVNRALSESLIQIPAPSDNVGGLTTNPLGRQAFKEGLRGYLQNSSFDRSRETESFTALWVLAQLERLCTEANEASDFVFFQPEEQWLVRRPTSLIAFALGLVSQCTAHFSALEREMPNFRYTELVAMHLKYCIFGLGSIKTTSKVKHFRSSDETQVQVQVQEYFDRLSILRNSFDVTLWQGWSDEKQAEEAWMVMMLKAFAWGVCHFMVPGERVPVSYYGSALPVWLS